MDDVPWALAAAAGTLAALNPCGFALLPVYLSALVVGDDAPSRPAMLTRALVGTAAITFGFVVVFALFGLVLTPVADTFQRQLPWFTVGLGLALAGVGGWLLAGRDIPGLTRWRGRGPAVSRTAGSMVLFGGAYALASLGCTVGPFLSIVVSTFRADSLVAGVALFVAYAVGMGLVVGTAAVAVALARTGVLSRLRRAGPVTVRVGGAVAMLGGGYVAYYGWYEVRVWRGADPADDVITAAGALQGWLEDLVGRLGVGGIALVFATVIAGAAAVAVWSARSPRA
jgi:cytochrome c biogenesis protein CcdA